MSEEGIQRESLRGNYHRDDKFWKYIEELERINVSMQRLPMALCPQLFHFKAFRQLILQHNGNGPMVIAK